MTEFEAAVLEVLRSLRRGEIVTYGEVAELAGYPGRARGVGRILSQTDEEVPWWRVVGHGGRLVSPNPR
ncbi:MAG: MGMT family protein [Acidimicrobiia bacterium]